MLVDGGHRFSASSWLKGHAVYKYEVVTLRNGRFVAYSITSANPDLSPDSDEFQFVGAMIVSVYPDGLVPVGS